MWQIENFYPVFIEDSTYYGKFYVGDCYIILNVRMFRNIFFRIFKNAFSTWLLPNFSNLQDIAISLIEHLRKSIFPPHFHGSGDGMEKVIYCEMKLVKDFLTNKKV